MGPRQNIFSIEVSFTVTFPAHPLRVSRRFENIPRERIEAFIAYFNETMAKPFRWTFSGKPLAA